MSSVALYAHGLRMSTCFRFSNDLCGMQCTLRMQWPLRKADMLAHTCRKREHFQVCTRTFGHAACSGALSSMHTHAPCSSSVGQPSAPDLAGYGDARPVRHALGRVEVQRCVDVRARSLHGGPHPDTSSQNALTVNRARRAWPEQLHCYLKAVSASTPQAALGHCHA